MEFESYFDAGIIRNGNSQSITIPIDTVEKLDLKVGEVVEVAIKRNKSSEEENK